MQAGVAVSLKSVQASEHSTRPPPRYTEAALVKALESRGIGRPSTYASTMKVLQVQGPALGFTKVLLTASQVLRFGDQQ